MSPAVKLTSTADSKYHGIGFAGRCTRTPTSTAAAAEKPIAAHEYMLIAGNA
ncbi:hypothetical protein [Paractinoplanes durhamensis]|uniref:hypothetical protein n=1 Tax=Paractinoplanes durhamensis TaxID=113563 RepID=UPI00363AC44D